MTDSVLADFLNRLNTLASDYGLVVGGYQQEEGMLQLLMVKTLGAGAEKSGLAYANQPTLRSAT